MKRILWDVDTQRDFMEPDGALSFAGALDVAPAMGRLVEAARAADIPHVASADDHELIDAEISDEPDWQTTFPPHCLRGTRGAQKIDETVQHSPVPLALAEVPDKWLAGREFLLLKKSVDVFTNPHADRVLQLLDPEEVVVFGVATDICDDYAVRGLLARGRAVTFVEDAARGLDANRSQACVSAWRELGARVSTVDEVLAAL